MEAAQARLLADGRRLHLRHGPIDLIVEAFGRGRDAAYRRAVARFEPLLQELVDELPRLRRPAAEDHAFAGPTARRMQAAVAVHAATFVTPMAAVAGAVADEVLAAMTAGDGLDKAYVNNGGDCAFFLTGDQRIDAAIAGPTAGRISIGHADPFRGVATSGWRGRSHSLGIADSVSVVAADAAHADAAATLIANAVDLPGHPAVERVPARELFPDSDLGDRPVTTGLGDLTDDEIAAALEGGVAAAEDMARRGAIAGAVLMLRGAVRHAGRARSITETTRELIDA